MKKLNKKGKIILVICIIVGFFIMETAYKSYKDKQPIDFDETYYITYKGEDNANQ